MKFNKVIKILIFSDLALLTGLGFVSPIFAIFLTDNIKGGTVEVVGFAAAIYWITECIVTIPFGRFLDKNSSERIDLIFVIIGNLLSALAVFGYMFASLPWHIYVLEAMYAVGMGMNIPGYTAIFTRHIDKGREAFSWSVRSASVAAGSGIAGALGGIIVSNFGFNVLFSGVIVFTVFSSFLPFLIFKNMKLKNGAVAEGVPEIKTAPTNLPK
jgi:MFS family permease